MKHTIFYQNTWLSLPGFITFCLVSSFVIFLFRYIKDYYKKKSGRVYYTFMIL